MRKEAFLTTKTFVNSDITLPNKHLILKQLDYVVTLASIERKLVRCLGCSKKDYVIYFLNEWSWPKMLAHYIEHHNYLPSKEFLDFIGSKYGE
jgi:hypothetical protein